MFPTEQEKQTETVAERDRRRARTGVDRRGLKQVAIAMTLLFGGMTLLAAAEIAGVEKRQTTATVVGLVDRAHGRRGRDCVTQLSTGYGDAEIYTRNLCQYAPWNVGDKAVVMARELRLSGTIVVNTQGTKFEGAYSMLPES